MRRLSIILLLILSGVSTALSQLPANLLKQLSQIKLLESNRNDLKRILIGFDATDYDDHFQRFSNEALDIEVTYSSGECADDSDEEDASEIWNVPEWNVTRIEISLEEAVDVRAIGFDLSKFKKEPRFIGSTDSLVFHDKFRGLAFKTVRGGIEQIIVYPSKNKVANLCKRMSAAKGFYTRKGWFSAEKPDDSISCGLSASVNNLELDVEEIEEGSSRIVAVAASASDPENDVLTYRYIVSGGKITGSGANVVWDLTGVPPGTYIITAGVDEGAGIMGRTVTKTVVVK